MKKLKPDPNPNWDLLFYLAKIASALPEHSHCSFCLKLAKNLTHDCAGQIATTCNKNVFALD